MTCMVTLQHQDAWALGVRRILLHYLSLLQSRHNVLNQNIICSELIVAVVRDQNLTSSDEFKDSLNDLTCQKVLSKKALDMQMTKAAQSAQNTQWPGRTTTVFELRVLSLHHNGKPQTLRNRSALPQNCQLCHHRTEISGSVFSTTAPIC
jgi:hypothetical protein